MIILNVQALGGAVVESTQRSVPAFGIALIAIGYAIAKGEPSSAILAAGVMLYTALNAVTPDKE